MTTRDDTLRAGLAAVGALMTVLAGDGKRDRGLLAKRHQGQAHLRECNRGLPTRRRVW